MAEAAARAAAAAELEKLVDSMDLSRGLSDLRSSLQSGKMWDNRQLMGALNDRSHTNIKAFKAVNNTMKTTIEAAKITEAKVEVIHEEVTEMKQDILDRVKETIDVLEDKTVRKDDLQTEINKGIKANKITTEVRALEKAVIADEKGYCTTSLIIHGLKPLFERREKPNETLELIWTHFLRHLKLSQSDITVISATRLPKGKNSNKAAPVKVKFMTPQDVYVVFENLHNLKGVQECKGIHVERDIPQMLNGERKKANAIIWQFRQNNGKDFQAKVWYPGNKAQVAVRKKGETEYKEISKADMKKLYEQNQKGARSWGSDVEDDDELNSLTESERNAKRQRSTPGDDRSSKAQRISDTLFRD